ncbi:MAG: hypothetical protein BWY87_01440 [Deltaproteobacteria bacterium ADurb.Bin510]|nr:MAG: hypothetical protein BWY87_01440 [Deltaproteobacteria bacterium ADurb.Bin510]
MVFLAENLSLDEAACCRVEVMKGGSGLRVLSLRLTSLTVMAGAFSMAALTASAAAWSAISLGITTWAGMTAPLAVLSSVSIVQYSSGLKLSISAWRSQIRRTATDCTRPPDRPGLTFFQSSGLMV